MSKKLTKNQQKVFDYIAASSSEISAQSLHFQLKEAGLKIGLATVYRTLKILKIAGKIQERVTPEGESFYSQINTNAHHHHHHLNCVNCGKSYPMDCCPVDRQIDLWSKTQEFQIFYHTLEFFGLCEACQST